MNEDTIEALAEFLNGGIRSSPSETPQALAGTKFLEKRITPPSQCPGDNCTARIYNSFETETDGIAYEVVCKQGCDHKITQEEAVTNRFQPVPTMAAIADHLDLTPNEGEWVDVELPRYVEGTTEEGINLCLIVDPHKYANTIRDILFDAVDLHQPTVLFTPRESADEVIEIAESYPLGSLVTPLPVELLTERGAVTDLVDTARKTREMEELVFEKRGIDDNELARKLSQRPRLIEAQFTYIRVLREDSTRRPKLGEQMETVCKAAFMAIGGRLQPEFGGTESRGTSIPDLAFQLPYHSDEEKARELREVLAIVDAKSGSDADFENEDIIGKHKDYIRYAKEQEVYNSYDLTHIFVVFDIDGYNEIDWFDGIKSVYRKNTGMVVLHADALMLMVRAAQSSPVRNQVNVSEGAFEDFIRPFFQNRLFTDDDAYPHVATMTRFDHVDDPTMRQEKYQHNYARRPDLLVVTADMVRRRFEDVVDKDGIDTVLGQYGET